MKSEEILRSMLGRDTSPQLDIRPWALEIGLFYRDAITRVFFILQAVNQI